MFHVEDIKSSFGFFLKKSIKKSSQPGMKDSVIRDTLPGGVYETSGVRYSATSTDKSKRCQLDISRDVEGNVIICHDVIKHF